MCQKCNNHLYCPEHRGAARCPSKLCGNRPIEPCRTMGEVNGAIATLSMTNPFIIDRACSGSGWVGHHPDCHNVTRRRELWTANPPAQVVQLEFAQAEVIELRPTGS